MTRLLKVAAAQVGAVHRWSPRPETLTRLIKLLEDAASRGAQLVVFPETTLTTFFPRYLIHDEKELQSYFEHDDVTQSAQVAPLFEKARELKVDLSVGYAEMTKEKIPYNTCIYYSGSTGTVLAKYRKSHLPGTAEPFENPGAVQQLEKRYFREGTEGFKAFRAPGLVQADPIMGMLICNDRRWPEAWRVYGLQGVEIVLCGYNSPAWAPDLWGLVGEQALSPEKARKDAEFHHKLVMQSNSYMNSCFSICAARAGHDDNKFPLIGGSCIVDPLGHVIAEAKTENDEVVFAEIDLDWCRPGKETTFNFGKHRRPELYRAIVEQKGVVEPPPLESLDMAGSLPSVRGTSPRDVRILLINPNSTSSMTANCLKVIAPKLPSDTVVTGFTAPRPSPSAIEGQVDGVLSTAACLRALLPIASQYDAFLVACFSAHPLITALREEVTQPVMGIMEAALYSSRICGARLGVLTTSSRSKVQHDLAIWDYGLGKFNVGSEAANIPVLDLEALPEDEVNARLAAVAKMMAEEKGADCISLGCAGMAQMHKACAAAVGMENHETMIIDGLGMGVQILAGLVREGLGTAKGGLYQSAANGRMVRKQDWY